MFEVGQKVRLKKWAISDYSIHSEGLVGLISRVHRDTVRVFFPLAPRDYMEDYQSADPIINLSYLFLIVEIESAED